MKVFNLYDKNIFIICKNYILENEHQRLLSFEQPFVIYFLMKF